MKVLLCICHEEFIWGLVLDKTEKDANTMLTEQKSKNDVQEDKLAQIIYLHNIWQSNGNI